MLNKTTIAALAALFAFGQGLLASDIAPAQEPVTAIVENVSNTSGQANTGSENLTQQEEHATSEKEIEASSEEHEEGLLPNADILFRIPLGGSHSLPITNSVLTSWIVSLLLILVINLVAGRAKLIPSKGQMIIEGLVGQLREILEMIVGPKMIGKTFPVLIGFFLFILIQNWCGLIPGLGAITYHGSEGTVHLFRPANADLNMTLGLALAHFVAWLYFVMRYAGPKVLMLDLFGNKAPKSEVPTPIYLLMFVLFAGVGIIEVISLLFRNISLPFRLYGNIYGGDQLMESMTHIAGWFIPVPFYFMELLVGMVQAMVFTILVAVYIGQICNHGGDEEHAH